MTLLVTDIEELHAHPRARDAAPGLLFAYVTATGQEMGAAWADGTSLPSDLHDECHDLPGLYEKPGTLLVAVAEEATLGCVGLRALEDQRMELRRLWVWPEYRRAGVATALVTAAIAYAGEQGFAEVVLDVLPSRPHVVTWYRSLGFTEIAAYEEPFVPMVFLGLPL